MSKSGSRYGRRSNWFKIHCLLQEQQNKANNNSISQNGNNVVGNNGLPSQAQHPIGNANILPNDFISSHFLANLYSNYSHNNNNGSTKSQEIKRVSSPSDSGASSADPDEKFHNNNNNNNNSLLGKTKNLNLLKPRSNSFSEKIEKANSSSNDGYISPVIGRKISNLNSSMKPLSPFLPFSLHHSLSSSALSSRTPSTPEYFMLPLPQISLTPSPLQKLAYSDEQHEPIDLSVKSTKRLRDYEPDEDEIGAKTIRASTPLSPPPPAPMPKTVPLDLTLVRSG
jgi:nuclear receptor subfamily 0 group A